VLAPKRQYGGLPRATLVRAVEFIQDQLDADLTVSGIAQAVCMSRYYFTSRNDKEQLDLDRRKRLLRSNIFVPEIIAGLCLF
jgi:AraC-like DNA-binding protein